MPEGVPGEPPLSKRPPGADRAWPCPWSPGQVGPCRRYVTADAMGMAKVRGKLEGEECRWCRNRVGDKNGERHHDAPRFGALLRDNTPTPACFFYINAPGYNNSSGYSGEGERRRGLALLLP